MVQCKKTLLPKNGREKNLRPNKTAASCTDSENPCDSMGFGIRAAGTGGTCIRIRGMAREITVVKIREKDGKGGAKGF